MLSSYRRHLKTCPHRAKGQAYSLCQCPIWAYGTVAGKQVRQSLGTNDPTRANRRMERLERGESIAATSAPMLSVAVARYLESAEVTESTRRRYKGTTDALLAFGDRPVSAITTDWLKAYRAQREVAPGTMNTEIGHLRQFFRWCMEEKWISENPAKGLRLHRIDDLQTEPFTADEVATLLRACDRIANTNPDLTDYIRRRARALVLTLLYSGLRISDVAKLERSALSGRHLTLRVLKTGVRQKVLLSESAVAALQALPSSNPRYFFWSGSSDLDTCIGNLRKVVAALGRRAKVHAHPHRFRDTFAVELLTNGADIRTVQQLLGHKTVRTTEKHYAHFVAAHQALLDSAASTLNFERGAGGPVLLKPSQKAGGDA